jgi:hypothetical protein
MRRLRTDRYRRDRIVRAAVTGPSTLISEYNHLAAKPPRPCMLHEPFGKAYQAHLERRDCKATLALPRSHPQNEVQKLWDASHGTSRIELTVEP